MKYLIANWKANKNLTEAEDWIDIVIEQQFQSDRIKIVLCPPAALIYPLKQKLRDEKNIVLGSQDVSAFASGSYTGEVTAKSLEGLADYAIIGHSERRKYFNETDEIVQKKIKNAIKYNIEPILCIRNEKDFIPADVKMIAYEPVYAIGTGSNEPVEKIIEMKKKLDLRPDNVFIYGGSVDKNNVVAYLKKPDIDGLLIGIASLDSMSFFDIVNQA